MQTVAHSSLSSGVSTRNAQVQHFWEFCRLYFELLLHVLIRLGFWGILYCNYKKEPPKIM